MNAGGFRDIAAPPRLDATQRRSDSARMLRIKSGLQLLEERGQMRELFPANGRK
jgi:hypothetical protein